MRCEAGMGAAVLPVAPEINNSLFAPSSDLTDDLPVTNTYWSGLGV